MSNQERILLVDDELRILTALSRRLEDEYLIDTATSGISGLKKLKEQGPYALVISDLRMPNMDGIEFLRQVAKVSPRTVRILLTGYADVPSATRAVNESGIFRLLTKPCSQDTIQKALEEGLAKFRLDLLEREMLNKTLRGSIGVIAEIVKLIDPLAYDDQPKAKRIAGKIAQVLGIGQNVKLELSVMLSNIGSVTIPFSVLLKLRSNQNLNAEEQQILEQIPKASRDLVMKIPRLEEVAEIILYQAKHYDGSGYPKDKRKGEDLPICSRILKVSNDLVRHTGNGLTPTKALEQMEAEKGVYDPKVISALREVLYAQRHNKGRSSQGKEGGKKPTEIREVSIEELQIGHTVARDLKSILGTVLLPAGTVVSDETLSELKLKTNHTKPEEGVFIFE